jgi:hypothetical protein
MPWEVKHIAVKEGIADIAEALSVALKFAAEMEKYSISLYAKPKKPASPKM